MYEDEGFRSRQFAALVASKVFYHLGAFEESLNYALGAGDLFNVNDNSEYVETIIGNYLPCAKALYCQLLSCSSAYSIFSPELLFDVAKFHFNWKFIKLSTIVLCRLSFQI